MNREKLQKAKEYIQAHREDMVRDLMELCRVPSIRSEAEEGAPFGKEVLHALEVTRDLHARNGLRGELSPGKTYLLTPYGEGERTIGIFAHADVVPVQDDWMYTEPFSPIEKDDFVIARGSADNKAAIVQSLYLVKALQAAGIELKSKLLLFTGGNEESGMADVADFVRENPMPDLSFVPDGGWPVSRGEKGILRFDLTAPVCGEILSIDAGEAYNMVPDLARAVLAPKEELWEEIEEKAGAHAEISLEKTPEGWIVSAQGVSRHASYPFDGVNAIWRLAEFLREITGFSPLARSLAARIAGLTGGFLGEALGISADDEVFGQNTCVCGFAKTQDGELTLGFDIRYGRAMNGDQLTERISKHALEYAFPMTKMEAMKDPFLIPLEDGTLQMITKIYREATGKEEAEPFLMSGGTYSRILKRSYTVGDNNGSKKPPFDLPKGHGGAHQRDEVVEISGMLSATELLLEII